MYYSAYHLLAFDLINLNLHSQLADAYHFTFLLIHQKLIMMIILSSKDTFLASSALHQNHSVIDQNLSNLITVCIFVSQIHLPSDTTDMRRNIFTKRKEVPLTTTYLMTYR